MSDVGLIYLTSGALWCKISEVLQQMKSAEMEAIGESESLELLTDPGDKRIKNYVTRLEEVKNIHSQILRLRKLAVEAEKLRRDKDESLAALISIRELNKKTIQKTNSLVARSKQEVDAMRTRLHQTVSYTRKIRARCRGKVETLSQINERLVTEMKKLQDEVATKDRLIEKLKTDHEKAKTELSEIRADHERDAEALQILRLKYRRLERKVRGLAMSVSGSTERENTWTSSDEAHPPAETQHPQNSRPEVAVECAQGDNSSQNIDVIRLRELNTRKSSSGRVRFGKRMSSLMATINSDNGLAPSRSSVVGVSVIKPPSPFAEWSAREEDGKPSRTAFVNDFLLNSDHSICRCPEPVQSVRYVTSGRSPATGTSSEETKLSQIKDFVLNLANRGKSKSCLKPSTTVVRKPSSRKAMISEGKTFTLTREEIEALARTGVPQIHDVEAAKKALSAESGDCLLARIKPLSQDSLMEAKGSSLKSATNCTGDTWMENLRRKLSREPE